VKIRYLTLIYCLHSGTETNTLDFQISFVALTDAGAHISINRLVVPYWTWPVWYHLTVDHDLVIFIL